MYLLGCTVERSLDGSTGWTELSSTLPANATSYSDTGLSAGTTYCHRVRATNGADSSDNNSTAKSSTHLFSED